MSDNLLKIEKNVIDTDMYLRLRDAVGWKKLTREQAKKALDNSLCTLCVTLAGQPIGMGRLVGDGSVICYIQDLIIHPHAQGMGVGSLLMNGLIDYVKEITPEGTEMMLDLMCAKGREDFYIQHGFTARPTQTLGPGMIMYIKK
jgi:GNAT superfamily N-acetyltransferase